MDSAADNIENGELFRFFKEKSNGVGHDFASLWKVCTGYVDNFELSRDLSKLVKLKLVDKREKHYFYSDPTVEIKRLLNVPADPPPPPPPPPVVRRVERKAAEVPPPVAEKPAEPKIAPMGDLRRGVAVTPIALAFYYNPQTEMNTAELHKRTGINKQVASQTVRRLAEGGYIEATGTGRGPSYRWTGSFRYPFPETKPEDWSWKNSKIEKALPAPEPQEKHEVASIRVASFGQDPQLRALDAVIERYQNELNALRAAREAYVRQAA